MVELRGLTFSERVFVSLFRFISLFILFYQVDDWLLVLFIAAWFVELAQNLLYFINIILNLSNLSPIILMIFFILFPKLNFLLLLSLEYLGPENGIVIQKQRILCLIKIQASSKIVFGNFLDDLIKIRLGHILMNSR